MQQSIGLVDLTHITTWSFYHVMLLFSFIMHAEARAFQKVHKTSYNNAFVIWLQICESDKIQLCHFGFKLLGIGVNTFISLKQ